LYKRLVELAAIKAHRLRPPTRKLALSQLQDLILDQLIIGKRKILTLMRTATLGSPERRIDYGLRGCHHRAQLESVLHIEIELTLAAKV
jgi:hypothetical protein